MVEPTNAWVRTRSAAADQVRHPVVAVALGMVLAQALFRAWMLAPGWFYTDDYILLNDALTSDLTGTYLLLPDNGHLMPGTRLVYFVVAHSGWMNWTLATAIGVGLQAVASVCAIWMLATTFGRRWAILAPLSLYLTTAITAQASLWWVSVINQTPVQIAMFSAIACWVSYLRTGSLRWLTGTTLALLLGLAFFQKTLLVLAVLVFVMLAYFSVGNLLRRLRYVVGRHWLSAVVLGGTATGYLAYYLSATAGSGSSRVGDWTATFTQMFLRAFPTGITGGPNGWSSRPGGAWADPSGVQLLVSWSLILAVVGMSVALRQRAARAWILVVGYYAILATAITVTRSGYFGSDIALAYRLQTDGVVVTMLALGLAFLSVPGAAESSEPRRPLAPSTHLRLRILLTVSLAVVCVNGIGNWVWFARDWHGSNESKRYVQRLHQEIGRIGPVDLTDRVVPTSVLGSIAAPDNTLSTVAAAVLGPRASFPVTTPRLVTTSPQGGMYQALIAPTTKGASRPQGPCGWQIDPGSWTRITLRDDVEAGRWWIRLGYLGAGRGQAKIRIGGDLVTAELSKGLHSVFVRTDGPVDSVLIGDLTPGAKICLDTVEVGTPRLGVKL